MARFLFSILYFTSIQIYFIQITNSTMKAGNNPEKKVKKGQKVTKSISRVPMVVETWLTPQNDLKS